MRLLTRQWSALQEISVVETDRLDGRPGRYRLLQFADEAIQGAMDLQDPGRIVLEYPRAMIHLMEYNRPSFDRVFVLGHGIGSLAGFYPEKRFKVAEIDERVVALSRAYFGYAPDNVAIGDGRALLEAEPPAAFDYIVLDAFHAKGTPVHLRTLEFFALTREKLAPGGALLMNVMARAGRDAMAAAILTTLGEVYPCTQAFVLPGARDGAADLRNLLLAGSDTPLRFQQKELAGFVETTLEPGYCLRDK